MIGPTAPLLIGAVGIAGLTAWFAKSVYILIPALLIGLGVVGFALHRRRAAAQNCSDPAAGKRGTSPHKQRTKLL